VGLASDERAIGRFSGLPLPVLGLTELLLTAACLRLIVHSVPCDARRRTFAWIVVGIALGLFTTVTLGNAVGIPVGTPWAH